MLGNVYLLSWETSFSWWVDVVGFNEIVEVDLIYYPGQCVSDSFVVLGELFKKRNFFIDVENPFSNVSTV